MAQETYAYNEVYGVGPVQRIQKTVVGEANAPNIVTTQYADNMGRILQEGRILNSTEYIDYYTYDYVGNTLTMRTGMSAKKTPIKTSKQPAPTTAQAV